MSDLIAVQGVVLSAMPVGEYDRRIVLLTRECGKISVFAKGARRQNNPFMAVTIPFVFGTFHLYAGKTSYNLQHVSVQHQFSNLSTVQPGVYYGYYFLELADYFGREGTDEKEMMNLLYVTVKAILNPAIDDRLIRCIYELRTMAEQGMCPQLGECVSCGSEKIGSTSAPEWLNAGVMISQEAHGIVCSRCAGHYRDAYPISESTRYAMHYIVTVHMGKLYGFRVSEEVLRELEAFIHTYVEKNTDKKFKSLDILRIMM